MCGLAATCYQVMLKSYLNWNMAPLQPVWPPDPIEFGRGLRANFWGCKTTFKWCQHLNLILTCGDSLRASNLTSLTVVPGKPRPNASLTSFTWTPDQFAVLHQTDTDGHWQRGHGLGGDGPWPLLLSFLNFIEFMGMTPLTKSYRFQVCNSITCHLYIVLCVHHPQSSLLLCRPVSPISFTICSHPRFLLVISILLSVSMRCLGFLLFFCLIRSPVSLSPSNTLPSDSCQSVRYTYESVCQFILFIRFHI